MPELPILLLILLYSVFFSTVTDHIAKYYAFSKPSLNSYSENNKFPIIMPDNAYSKIIINSDIELFDSTVNYSDSKHDKENEQNNDDSLQNRFDKHDNELKLPTTSSGPGIGGCTS